LIHALLTAIFLTLFSQTAWGDRNYQILDLRFSIYDGYSAEIDGSKLSYPSQFNYHAFYLEPYIYNSIEACTAVLARRRNAGEFKGYRIQANDTGTNGSFPDTYWSDEFGMRVVKCVTPEYPPPRGKR